MAWQRSCWIVVYGTRDVIKEQSSFFFAATGINSAAVLGSSKHAYVSARVAGTSFTVSTGDGKTSPQT